MTYGRRRLSRFGVRSIATCAMPPPTALTLFAPGVDHVVNFRRLFRCFFSALVVLGSAGPPPAYRAALAPAADAASTPASLVARIPGNILLGGMFPVHQDSPTKLCAVLREDGIQVMAFG